MRLQAFAQLPNPLSGWGPMPVKSDAVLLFNKTLNSPGQPLATNTRAFMESRFGHDFSNVPVRADGKAAESTRAVNTLEYRVGQDVVFGARQYQPFMTQGRKLLAYESTHVIQQGRGIHPFRVDQLGDVYGREADRAAADISLGCHATINQSGVAPLMQRQADPAAGEAAAPPCAARAK